VRKTGDGSVTTHTKTADQTWAAAHGWTTRERIEETQAAIEGVLDHLMDECPVELMPLVIDAASAIRWHLKQLIDQR
jgi:hypothetical protein